MIAVGTVSEYGVQGRKTRELKDFLVRHIERRTVRDEKEYKKMKHFISRQVTELNARYPNTVAICFKPQDPFAFGVGSFRFVRPNASSAILTATVLEVKPYEEGGSDDV